MIDWQKLFAQKGLDTQDSLHRPKIVQFLRMYHDRPQYAELREYYSDITDKELDLKHDHPIIHQTFTQEVQEPQEIPKKKGFFTRLLSK